MQPAPIPGFITKKETAEQFQRSHRQLTRDLADAMKVQDPKVLGNCRLRTEDGAAREGMGVTPELLDELRLGGHNPVWYLRVSWLEKTYGRRGHLRRRDPTTDDASNADNGEGPESFSRRDVVHVLRQQLRALEQDKQDLREELKIKNQQIADSNEREKETNSLMRDLHSLMGDLQSRLLPPPTEATIVLGAERPVEPTTQVTREAVLVDASPQPTAPEKGSRTPPDIGNRKSPRKPVPKKASTAKRHSPKPDAQPPPKPKGLFSRLFSR